VGKAGSLIETDVECHTALGEKERIMESLDAAEREGPEGGFLVRFKRKVGGNGDVGMDVKIADGGEQAARGRGRAGERRAKGSAGGGGLGEKFEEGGGLEAAVDHGHVVRQNAAAGDDAAAVGRELGVIEPVHGIGVRQRGADMGIGHHAAA
jgi:hypothetical protein